MNLSSNTATLTWKARKQVNRRKSVWSIMAAAVVMLSRWKDRDTVRSCEVMQANVLKYLTMYRT